MSDPNAFSVIQLKEFLKARELTSSGTKTELITRLIEADPSGEWMREANDNDDDDDHDDHAGRNISNENRRELEICRREKEIAERELELARREIALLRDRQDINRARQRETVTGNDNGVAPPHLRINLTTIADLLANFDGNPSNFDAWERMAKFLKTTYKLEDDQAKILVGMRLKGKALEWLHSKPELISMSFDMLIEKLRAMFCHRQNKMMIRRKFEARGWKKDETFREYVHEKVIMGNRVPIETDDMIDYVIEGIPEIALRNQARLQRFANIESLLEAFELITLRDYHANSNRSDRRSSGQTLSERDNKMSQGEKKNDNTSSNERRKVEIKRCFNCGMRDHISANCPSKDRGTKCFKCGEFGHIASQCLKKNDAPSSCIVTHSLRNKYTRNVAINGREIEALILDIDRAV